MNSLQGSFLVASPHLADPNFFRTVVLMIQHNEEGAFGVVLNRPGKKTVSEVWRIAGEELDCPCEQLINLGGPVDGPLLALHTDQACGQGEVMPGLFVATHKDLIQQLIRTQASFRIMCGYAGWGPRQLEGELEAGGWLHCPASLTEVFACPDAMWKQITGKIGLQVIAPTLGKRRVPDEPWWN